MSLAIPAPQQLVQRYIAALAQQAFRTATGEMVTLDATAPATPEQALMTVLALGNYEIYLFLRDYAQEFMVTTATNRPGGLLAQHARQWGVPRNPAQAAIGRVIINATQPVTLPQGALLTSDGTIQYRINQAIAVPPYQETPALITCTTTGTGGNLTGNTSLTLVSPVPGIVSVVVDNSGISGGSDIEDVESWRARIIDVIRNPYDGGSVADYIKWARNAGAAFVNVVPQYFGEGTVGIIIALPGPAAPTEAEIQRVQDYIESVRPVCGHPTVVAARISAQSPVIALNPDTETARQAVQAAIAAVYSGTGIGGTLWVEELQSAIYSANGPKNTLLEPLENVVFAADEIPVLAGIDWQAR